MKRVLFIDRDGTIIEEPKEDFQVDSFDKFSFLPGCIHGLGNIARNLDFVLVIVTNQDGLGTSSYPEDTFWPVQNKMIQILEGEDIIFEDIYIDRTFENNPSPGRKPGTAMLGKYLSDNYDLKNSFVLGDRLSDMELAKNIGCKGIFIDDNKADHESIVLATRNWNKIFNFLRQNGRSQQIHRKTKETDVKVMLSLDGEGTSKIDTGLSFFDHMLEQLARHGQLDLKINVKGDLHVDEHHTIEDVAITLGEAFYKATENKLGMMRYGFTLPMDDCLAQVAIDFGGRPWLVWAAEFKREKIGDVPTEMFYHFFKSFSDAAKCNLNIKVEGENEHHKIESIFKAFAKAIAMAKKVDVNDMTLPSTKGTL